MRSFLLLAALLAVAPATARPPVETPRLLANGWHYGEAGNYCMAIRALPSGERLSMRLAKWDDMSDSLIFWAPALPALDLDDEAAAEKRYGLEVRIDGRAVNPIPFMRSNDYLVALKNRNSHSMDQIALGGPSTRSR